MAANKRLPAPIIHAGNVWSWALYWTTDAGTAFTPTSVVARYQMSDGTRGSITVTAGSAVAIPGKPGKTGTLYTLSLSAAETALLRVGAVLIDVDYLLSSVSHHGLGGESTVSAFAGPAPSPEAGVVIVGAQSVSAEITVLSVSATGGGVSDHGALTGLGDDDHAQYLNSARHAAINGNPHGLAMSHIVGVGATGIALGESASASAARTVLGLGNAATRDVGAGSGQVAHGDHSHDAAAISSGVLAVARGGTGTATPSLVAGANVTITGAWPNQTVAASMSGGIGAYLKSIALHAWPLDEVSGTRFDRKGSAHLLEVGGANASATDGGRVVLDVTNSARYLAAALAIGTLQQVDLANNIAAGRTITFWVKPSLNMMPLTFLPYPDTLRVYDTGGSLDFFPLSLSVSTLGLTGWIFVAISFGPYAVNVYRADGTQFALSATSTGMHTHTSSAPTHIHVGSGSAVPTAGHRVRDLTIWGVGPGGFGRREYEHLKNNGLGIHWDQL